MDAKRVLSLLACTALALGAAATPAAAQGLGAQASVELKPLGAVRECLKLGPDKNLRPCGLLGTRRIEVKWASSCGPQVTAENNMETKVKAIAEPPGPTDMPYLDLGPDDPWEIMPASGSGTFLLLAGWKLHAEATMWCRGPEPPEPPGPVDTEGPFAALAAPVVAQAPTETATARSVTVSAPPRLLARSVAFASYCARSRGQLKTLKGKLQAGRTGWLRYWIRYATTAQRPLLGYPSGAGSDPSDRKRIRLYASGAGIRVSGLPDRTAIKGFASSIELKLRPRKAGTLRVWATIDGVKTNALKMPVARGC